MTLTLKTFYRAWPSSCFVFFWFCLFVSKTQFRPAQLAVDVTEVKLWGSVCSWWRHNVSAEAARQTANKVCHLKNMLFSTDIFTTITIWAIFAKKKSSIRGKIPCPLPCESMLVRDKKQKGMGWVFFGGRDKCVWRCLLNSSETLETRSLRISELRVCDRS